MPAPWRKCSRATAREDRKEATAALDASQQILADTQSRSPEAEHFGHWLRRVRQNNHLSERVTEMLRAAAEEGRHGS